MSDIPELPIWNERTSIVFYDTTDEIDKAIRSISPSTIELYPNIPMETGNNTVKIQIIKYRDYAWRVTALDVVSIINIYKSKKDWEEKDGYLVEYNRRSGDGLVSAKVFSYIRKELEKVLTIKILD